MADLSRRAMLALVASAGAPATARAIGRTEATIGCPWDVPFWDPQVRLAPDAQPILKAVFDQPLELDSRLGLAPGLARAWRLSTDARTLDLEMREGVAFHDGTPVTSNDLRWSLLERFQAAPRPARMPDAALLWQSIAEIETPSPTRAVIRFHHPDPGAPQRLAGPGSFVLPRDYMTRVGAAGFAARPVGSGPYRLAEYRPGSRMVLERTEAHWGSSPMLRRVVVEVLRDTASRALAIRSGRLDLALAMPARLASRLASVTGLEAELHPIDRVVLLRLRGDGGFADRGVRLAAHHAIDKRALAQAFCNGVAQPLSIPATPGSPWHIEDVVVPHDPSLSVLLLEKAGYGPSNPVRLHIAATRGQFPGDDGIAQAVVAMWREVGIVAELTLAEPAGLDALERAGGLPEATLACLDADLEGPDGWAADTGTPLPPWDVPRIARRPSTPSPDAEEQEPASAANDWKAELRRMVEDGHCIPLLQGMQSVVRRAALSSPPHRRGWITPQSLAWI